MQGQEENDSAFPAPTYNGIKIEIQEEDKYEFENEGDCEIESARTSSQSLTERIAREKTEDEEHFKNDTHTGSARMTTKFLKDPSPRNKADGRNLKDFVKAEEDYNHGNNDGIKASPVFLPKPPLKKKSADPWCQNLQPADGFFSGNGTVNHPLSKKGEKKSKRKVIPISSKRQKKVTVTYREEMERLLYEIALRTQHKARSLEFEAQKLGETADNLRDENKSLKRLQRSQKREIHERHDFVDMANLSLRGVRRDVRDGEGNCVGAEAATRKKNKKVIKLQNECAKYDNLVKLGSRLPSLEELEESIEKAITQLGKKDERIEELQMRLAAQDKKVIQEQQKEKKRFLKLQEEIEESSRECHELKSRIKAAERKIDKTNIYSRKLASSAQALPAITWYPPSEEQTPANKVEKWLNKHKEQ